MDMKAPTIICKACVLLSAHNSIVNKNLGHIVYSNRSKYLKYHITQLVSGLSVTKITVTGKLLVRMSRYFDRHRLKVGATVPKPYRSIYSTTMHALDRKFIE